MLSFTSPQLCKSLFPLRGLRARSIGLYPVICVLGSSLVYQLENRSFGTFNMCGHFAVIDLISQGRAVQRLLNGMPLHEKLAWLAVHGKLSAASSREGFPQAYYFESNIGLCCCFFFQGDDLFFIGDNTTFRPND